MNKIEAVIQPFKLDDVKDALAKIGVLGITVTEVRGHVRRKANREGDRDDEYRADLLPRVKLETVVASEQVPQVVEVLSAAARTGKFGDGKVFVLTVREAIRIRNGDRGEAAL